MVLFLVSNHYFPPCFVGSSSPHLDTGPLTTAPDSRFLNVVIKVVSHLVFKTQLCSRLSLQSSELGPPPGADRCLDQEGRKEPLSACSSSSVRFPAPPPGFPGSARGQGLFAAVMWVVAVLTQSGRHLGISLPSAPLPAWVNQENCLQKCILKRKL